MTTDGPDGGLPSPARILPLRDAVAFPDTVLPLAVGQERTIALYAQEEVRLLRR